MNNPLYEVPRRWQRSWLLVGILVGVGIVGAAPVRSGETSAEQEGQQIVKRIRTTRPTENSSVEGVLKVFHGRRLHAVVPFRSEVLVTTTNWQVSYQTLATTNLACPEHLTIARDASSASSYHFKSAKVLDGDAARVQAFAGSDFLACDLGLDFLNWSGQRLLKKELRSSQSCYVIESTPGLGRTEPYSRVVTWLDIDSVRDFGAPAIVHADAYDAQNHRVKEFAPKDFRKVDGQWQVEEIQIENVQSGNRTKLEFQLERK